jgi:hypothetical protein
MLDCSNTGQSRSRESWKATPGSQGTYSTLKQAQWQPKKTINLLFLRGWWRRGNVIVGADDDDEMRNNTSQNCATATLNWGILPHDSIYICTVALSHISREVWGRQDIDGQHDTYRQSWLSFCSQPNLHTAEQCFRNLLDGNTMQVTVV